MKLKKCKAKNNIMSNNLDQSNPIRVYAEKQGKEFALVQIVDYYNETFRFEILLNVKGTLFPNIDSAKKVVDEFKKFNSTHDIDNFKYVDVIDYKK
ncbi:hypothetical protein [Chryseobacterium lathyri]|uniref:KTSC domain-containing protein n=1 Tax=Chryseobacterium lathyri TaxID=395933 RepID=A0ABT9SK10_9FLAO|nr:hypothetical protein [Chryseobacterium lathyri]MDP9959764.1 hypothetical protein [Chryseobacterium lathyri]